VTSSALLEALPALAVVSIFHGFAVLGAAGFLAASLARRPDRHRTAEPAA
jgi:hypothetical protein